MGHIFPQGSAKIYQFPVRVRATVAGDHEEVLPGADLRSSRIPGLAVASGWYHEAAIQDSNRDRER
jgi:hypothetical protein